MNRYGKAGKLLEYTVKSVTGISGPESRDAERGLCGISPEVLEKKDFLRPVLSFLREVGEGAYRFEKPDGDSTPFEKFIRRGVDTFFRYYTRPEHAEKVDRVLDLFDSGIDPELLAEKISKVWVPELEMDDDEILPRWMLKDLRANPDPIRPDQVVLQLNALYTLPEELPQDRLKELPPDFAGLVDSLRKDSGPKVADYDHPVPLFEKDQMHELVSCLGELDEELAFEKEKGVLPEDHRVPVLLSVSVTHTKIDGPAGKWIEWLLAEKKYHHMKVIVLTESRVKALKKVLGDDVENAGEESKPGAGAAGAGMGDTAEGVGKCDVFSVFGKYGRHFNALKYSQLFLERAIGIRAGFKLDTDEGIRSRDLYAATGATWFETLCHPYWGGNAVDWQERPVNLAVNEGEYINSTDIDRLGYPNSLRTPDVAIPNSWKGPNMFFQKGFAHGRTTVLYNRFQSVEEGISHTVVKGGGYGITNEGLRRAVPFTFSWVGRAEDQQFYFSGLSGGIRGIFHPNLRIAHYKSSVQGAEKKTEATRFTGDMYRLIIFQRLAEILGVKNDIDPMPGVFAGELARAQACFAVMVKSMELAAHGNDEAARYLIEEGIPELADLESRIDAGEVDAELRRERGEWEAFIEAVDRADPSRMRELLDL